MRQRAMGLGLMVAGVMLGAGCDLLTAEGSTSGGPDLPTTPYDPNTGECATNWRPVDEADLGTNARVEGEQLVMRSTGKEVAVRGLLGAPHSPNRGAVLRFDFAALDLGADGKLVVEMRSQEGTLSRLVVQPTSTVLLVETPDAGVVTDFAFRTPPTRMVFELDLQPDLAVEARAFFFEAGRGKVLTARVPRFEGGMVTSLMILSGSQAEARLERFARVDPGSGGLMEDFWCDSLGLATDRSRFPEGRATYAGKACSDDDQCGAGEYCVESMCRRACLASSQCLDQVCIILEDSALCSLPADTCEPKPGLVCGGDGALRLACSEHADCPRANDLCLGGACVSNDESVTRTGQLWGTCEFARERCTGDTIEVCDREGPGWTAIDECGKGECVEADGKATCDTCVRSCQDEDVYASCDGGPVTLFEDCKDGFEVCSTGPTGTDRPFCRPVIESAPAAAQVEVGPASAGFRIDAYEATRAQYLAFMQTAPSVAAQPAECAWNTTFAPPDWPWFDSPGRAAWVDHCDAVAYCASLGRRLCAESEWQDTCSSGGANDFPYGDAYSGGVCGIDPRKDVGSSPECTAPSGDYSGVFEMIGAGGEWVAECTLGSTSVRAADSCKTHGASASQTCAEVRTQRRDSVASIRCCAD